MVRESRVHADQLIYPIFVVEGEDQINPIGSMPGIKQFSLDHLLEEVERAVSVGIKSIILFGIPAEKDAVGTEAYNDEGIVQKAIRLVRSAYPELVIIADCCLCEYTSHGHCGIVTEHGEVLNDPTLSLLAKTAVSQAKAGADIIAPSDMMDGRVLAIREALDEAGFEETPIMSYAVKYASAYYGPFRDAAESAPKFGDRRTYQMDPANVQEAMREMQADIEEGADIFIVKPAGPYQDVIRLMHDSFDVPLAAYQVSGEYSMICAAANNGWIDRKAVVLESLIGLKRSGAKMIITYFTVEALREGWVR